MQTRSAFVVVPCAPGTDSSVALTMVKFHVPAARLSRSITAPIGVERTRRSSTLRERNVAGERVSVRSPIGASGIGMSLSCSGMT
jgi:hypothetical protein